mmetsp:Transcript_10489/g.23187  ORF Transcript_10489/g.23187 Transcript_10489/m.23187 type:complete len:109 (-) Transcript_10489:223-549(-)
MANLRQTPVPLLIPFPLLRLPTLPRTLPLPLRTTPLLSPAFQDEVEQCVALQAVMDGFPGCHELFAVVVNLGDQWDDRSAVPRGVEFFAEFLALHFIVGSVSVVEMFE